ncbi:hypothetical protein B0H21DRAFT_820274 [Amylocystis lapponica]|nr:hypothetical protein B0H21DRAFT_820274 [Amylocystis lapponica]
MRMTHPARPSELLKINIFAAALPSTLNPLPSTPVKDKNQLSPLDHQEFDLLQLSSRSPSSFDFLNSPAGSTKSSPGKYSTLSLGSPREYYPTTTSISALSQDEMLSDSDSDWDPVVDGLFDFDVASQEYDLEAFSDEDEDLDRQVVADDPEPPEMLDQEFVFHKWDFQSVRRVICRNPRYTAPQRTGSLLDSLSWRPLSPILEIRGLENMTGEALERDIEEEAILRRDQWELQRAGCGVAWVDPIEVTVEVRVEPVTFVRDSGNITGKTSRPRVFFSPHEVNTMQERTSHVADVLGWEAAATQTMPS